MEVYENFFIGIGGGTCAGKTSVAEGIEKRLEGRITLLTQDNYYEDQQNLSIEERKEQNYDHPDAFDWDLMFNHVKTLLEGESIDMPLYDFEKHTRKKETETVVPKENIILEGIFALYDKDLRDMMDLKVYVDTDADERVLRRVSRDIKERGRTLESVMKQYRETVKPMHESFVEETKKHSDIIIPRGGYNDVAMDMVVKYLKR